MPFPTLLALAVALAMDAFAVALATGICLRAAGTAQTLRMATAFGLFQALMPVAGWALGQAVHSLVQAYAPGTAFALLALIGGKMIWEGASAKDDKQGCAPEDPTRGLRLLVLSVATSIDALAVGLSFAVLGQPIATPALVIGLVCFAITAAGVRIGCLAGRVSAISRYAEFLGGAALIAIGLKIFLDR